MAYLGRGIENLSDRVVLDDITTSATATYNLTLNSVAFVPSSSESLTCSVNGVVQKSGGTNPSFTVSGSQIIFSSALTSSDSIDFIIAERGITLQTPSAGSVNTDQLAATAVTNAKIANSTIDVAKVADSLKMKPIFKAFKSANTNLSSSVSTIVVYNGILYNPQGAYDASTGKFTVPSGGAGFYFIDICNRVTGSSGLSFKGATTGLVVNGTNEDYFSHSYTNSSSTGNFNNDQIGLTTIRELAVGDEVQGRINLTVTTGTPILVGSSAPSGGAVTRFSMFRLIGV